ncbi:MAG: M23 family metallopeptidase [Chloroflexi bacterium]|nr:M23 family metallopeptidase [Chloroflexota bacterium]
MADTTKPVVETLTVFPGSVTAGDSFTIFYTVSESGGSGLKQVELWRAPDTGTGPGNWAQLQTKQASGKSGSGSFVDSPSSVGAYWYGIHAVDNASNWAPEDTPSKVTVHPAGDTTKPTVDDFRVFPEVVAAGGSFTIFYTVSDSGSSGLKQVELWRAPDTGAGPSNWAQLQTNLASGNSGSGSFRDSPSSVGTFWYGIHAVDNDDNLAQENIPIQVIVEPAADTTKPVVDDFTVSPESVATDGSFTIFYTVSESGGSGLKQVELWRAPDTGAGPGNWAQLQTKQASGNNGSGSFADSPSSVGAYWYGIHAVDNADNWAAEEVPLLVHVGPASSQSSKPIFQLPFQCGESWYAYTYTGHMPSENSLDINARAPYTKEDHGLGEPVLASANGTVTVASQTGWNDGYGTWIEIEHNDGWRTRYAHLIENSVKFVEGSRVVIGQEIGTLGKTGNTTAPHLHYEQRLYEQRLNGVSQTIEFGGKPVDYVYFDDLQGGPKTKLTSMNCEPAQSLATKDATVIPTPVDVFTPSPGEKDELTWQQVLENIPEQATFPTQAPDQTGNSNGCSPPAPGTASVDGGLILVTFLALGMMLSGLRHKRRH